mgnify:CR=1 FL=1
MALKRILSGMRPTGRLHIGHLAGALENWIKLQNSGLYQNYHLIADYHVLTTNSSSEGIEEDSFQMVIDWLSAGLDPEKSPLFRQSQIKEHTELFLIFSMLITVPRLERNPTLKDQLRDLDIGSVLYGHLGYPVLQAADILLYKGEYVPVGEDQVPHVEITREIARHFNDRFGFVFKEPEPLLTASSRLLGLDGNAKMSKSLGNTILLSDEPETVFGRLKKAVTDTQKVRKGDPGRPEVCVVYQYHQTFNSSETEEIATNCRSGALGCSDCKKRCSESINAVLAPFLEKRKTLEANPEFVRDVLADGEKRARITAGETMSQVREAMKLGIV